ncbi:4F2 cell-surface antigen heavy chain-like [Betta splendens]|uniref:4F2 cell-surface antigen heavy chain-like n=1 Tax=Betta splendens TaxID=158456 RepID=A0A6P7KVA7_BETSP|nr:4F2 cell-surface antigen heavy chain-like [Betta splendens]
MTKDTEVDMKDVELNEMDPEKQPMTADAQVAVGEKNGSVKLKVPEDEVAFTGLSKEELMKVAGTPGWVRTRWMLLVLFWLGWVGMLAGAIVIIVQAPRCKPLPEMNWWNDGPLYQIPDVDAFCGGLAGLEQRLDEISQLKVKGLVLGPLHTVQENQQSTLNLKEIDAAVGREEDLKSVLKKADDKGIKVVLDLTPNYKGSDSWFSSGDIGSMLEQVKAAAEHWLKLGVSGFKLSAFNVAANSPHWSHLQTVVQGNHTEGTSKRLLMGVVEHESAASVHQLLNTTGVALILSDLLSSKTGGERIRAMDHLHAQQRKVGWGLGAVQQDQLSKQATGPALIRLYQLLLLTMPGTPVFTYGDEIGLEGNQKHPKMVWNVETEAAQNKSLEEYAATRKWFKGLSDLRGKERSLLHGDYYPLYASNSSLSFLRVWDQSERYITAVNWGAEKQTLKLSLTTTEGLELPKKAKVKLSTDSKLEAESNVNLDSVELEPGQAVLLQFPYTG